MAKKGHVFLSYMNTIYMWEPDPPTKGWPANRHSPPNEGEETRDHFRPRGVGWVGGRGGGGGGWGGGGEEARRREETDTSMLGGAGVSTGSKKWKDQSRQATT